MQDKKKLGLVQIDIVIYTINFINFILRLAWWPCYVDKVFSYTSQHKYVFILEENVSHAICHLLPKANKTH